MKEKKKWQTIGYHIIAWLFFGALFYYYISQRLSTVSCGYRVGTVLSSFVSYVLIIYGYVYGLYPYYRIGRISLFSLLLGVTVLFGGVVLLRMIVENRWVRPLSNIKGSIYDWSSAHFAYAVTTSLVALLIAVLFTAVEEKIVMQKKQELMKRRQLEAELRLLKYQLQPHFLFNFLNNLYASVYKTLPDVASQIEKGADLMRYYLYNTTQEIVPISSETAYIHNLIDLERGRLTNPADIYCDFKIEEEVLVPPMLFAPIIENLFKHGLRHEMPDRQAFIFLRASRRGVHFSVSNPVMPLWKSGQRGVGLENLQERLQLLYGSDFTLTARQEGERFITTMILPPYKH